MKYVLTICQQGEVILQTDVLERGSFSFFHRKSWLQSKHSEISQQVLRPIVPKHRAEYELE
jgi:hypothetical protein